MGAFVMQLRPAFRRLTSLLLVASLCAGCSSKQPPAEEAQPVAKSDAPSVPAAVPSTAPPLPAFTSARCRIYTSSPGYTVFIDGEPARGSEGDWITTPCAVTAAPGTHTVTVARTGQRDVSQEVVFADDSEAVFDTAAAELSGESEALGAAYLSAVPGEPIPLESVNTSGRELDPYLTADGRSLWFVGERAEGRGLYVATRTSPLASFGEPQLQPMTRGADLPATPSVTADGRSVVYVIPAKARIWALTRPNPLADFDDRAPLYFREAPGEDWLSAQMLADGLRLYYVRSSAGKLETRALVRDSAGAKFKELVVEFPGAHPCLSSDGLRQYAYDGTTLTRARRADVRKPFAAPEKLLDLALPGYKPSPRHRQYFVTEDEQWMAYCDDPAGSGDLFLVRVFPEKSWGVALRGAPIEPRVVAVATGGRVSDSTDSVPGTTAPPADTAIDPRTLPLPYTKYRAGLEQLIAERDYEAAAAHLESARTNADLAAARELLDWDAADVARVRDFWSDVQRAVSGLKPGDEIRFDAARVEFVRSEGDTLHGKARTKEVQKTLQELNASSLLLLADRVLDPADLAAQERVATFLLYEPDAPAATMRRRLEAAAEGARQLTERIAARLLRQAQWELERDNLPRALTFVETLEKDHSGTQAGAAALALRSDLYGKFPWRQVGRRTWQTGPDGEFTAGDGRAEGAVLLSPQKYSKFQLSMEYRTNSSTGQGGVYFRYPGTGRLDRNSFKIQLSNDKGVNRDEYCTGSLFGVEAPQQNAARAQGEWNTFLMQVQGEAVKVSINGKVVLDTQAVENAIQESGHVALDGISGGISYRKVLLSGE